MKDIDKLVLSIFALLVSIVALSIALIFADKADAYPPPVRRCDDSRKAITFYRASYNSHRAKLSLTSAPNQERHMVCRRAIERAAYWRSASKINRLAVERRTLHNRRDWRSAVHEAQRVFPNTASWLLSCSARESRHGSWVLYGGRSYYPGAERARTFHGWMVGGYLQYMWPTFKGHYRHALDDARARGFIVNLPSVDDVDAWRSALAQALAGGWAIKHGQRSHWSASIGKGC